ncbi:PrgI family protein [Patescibacteria group bacterium]|nr:PrgI family protein [Patescibacteria group bacterium]MBP9709795.1 PrgI family protein [Patescibacteria group bacterium]
MPDKFVVPQFIDAEDKILGPITVRQFLICLGASFLIFIEYKIFTLVYFIFATVLTGGTAAAFAFLKINGQQFHIFFLNFLASNLLRPTLRTWQKGLTDAELRVIMKNNKPAPPIVAAPAADRPSSSRLRDLALTVNTGGVYNPDEDV